LEVQRPRGRLIGSIASRSGAKRVCVLLDSGPLEGEPLERAVELVRLVTRELEAGGSLGALAGNSFLRERDGAPPRCLADAGAGAARRRLASAPAGSEASLLEVRP